MTVRAASALVGVLLAAAGCSGDDRGGGEPASAETASAEAERTSAGGGETGGAGGEGSPALDVPDIVRRVQPSVVAIVREDGEGSGVIWDEDGVIVTNEHVVRGERTVQILFASGTRANARVRATDDFTDLAVIEVDAERLPAAEFAEKLPRIGETVVAMGNPFGFEETVTAGIISGLHRALPGSPNAGGPLVNLIQTDAGISPGNSGGVLVGRDGRVVGVNVAYIPPQRGAVEVGFAIPAPTVTEVVRELLRTGEARHAFLGIQPAELSPEVIERFDVEANLGVFVVDAGASSPAGRAGVERGDVIVSVDERPTTSVDEFMSALAAREPGEKVTLEVIRDAERRNVTATLGERPE